MNKTILYSFEWQEDTVHNTTFSNSSIFFLMQMH